MRIIRIDRPEWFARAACRTPEGTQLRMFFPSRGGTGQPGRSMCARCPVVNECLDYAVADPSLVGIWGRTDERQRDLIRQRRSA